MSQNNHFYVIPRRPELNSAPFRYQSPMPTVSGFRGVQPQHQHSSVIYGAPVPPRSPAPVLDRYPPAAAQMEYIQNGNQSTRKTAAQPPMPSPYYREEATPGRNFLTLPINRNNSRTPLQFPGSSNFPNPGYRSTPNSPQPVKAPASYYRTYSHSPFGTGHRSAPVLDKYPSVLTLNEVKITPLPGLKAGRYSTSAVPTVLERYPPALSDPHYQKPTNRNSAPLPGPNPGSVPPSPGSKKKKSQSPVADNFVPNRFRYPTSPITPNRIAQLSAPNFDYPNSVHAPPSTSIHNSRNGFSRPPVLQPPPPPPIIQQTQIHVSPIPVPLQRTPTEHASNFVRKPSLKVKRTSSTASASLKPTPPPQPPVPRRRAPPTNHPSRLLNAVENELVFQILGQGRQTLSTAIVQLLLPMDEYDPDDGWSLEGVTVLCFVRDATKRSYFLEFISLSDGCCIYSCEVYEEFDYKTKKNTRFLTFETEDTFVGVNFADDTEFMAFKDTLDKKIEAKRQRRHDRQYKVLDSGGKKSLRNGNSNSGFTESPAVHKEPRKYKFTFGRRHSNAKSKKNKGKKLGKDDIGTPLNFTHVSHAGYDPQHGFQSYGDIDIAKYKEVFQQAQISEQQLKDPETRKFIYKFVENYEKETSEKSFTSPAPPPPPPPPPSPMPNHRSNESVSPSPPPPPRLNPPKNNSGIYPEEPEPDYHPQHHKAPPPPPLRADRSPKLAPQPPLSVSTRGHPSPSNIPPPPPMPQSELSPAMVRRQVVETPAPIIPEADYDVRSNLLREIQEGGKGRLKPVDESSRPGNTSPEAGQMDGMAGALQRALAERSRAINPDTSESESDDEAFDSEEWEDE